MAKSHRVFYENVKGRIPKNWNLPGFNITQRSAVLVTAAQWKLDYMPPRPPQPGFHYFSPDTRLIVHGPDIYVTNIVPHPPEGGAGGVEFILHVNSDTPINVAVTITVFEPWESYTKA